MFPSFGYKISEARRRRGNPALAVNDKATADRVFAACDVPRPATIAIVGLDELTPAHVSAPVMVKPLRSKNSWGARAVVPTAGGAVEDLLTGERASFSELVEGLRGERQRHDFPDRWILQELLLPVDGSFAPVEDLKVYAFRGAIGCILQRAARPRRYRWWTPDWEPVDVGKYRDQIDDGLRAPTQGAEVLDIARRVSARLPIPFMRVDLFETASGVVGGELTPHPGLHDRFSPEWDRRLGELYEEAETDLLACSTSWRSVTDRRIRRALGRRLKELERDRRGARKR